MKKKILIMGFTKIKYMPYMNFYLDCIDKEKNHVHLLYWDRDSLYEDTSALENVTLHRFGFKQTDDVSKLLKIKSFREYRKFALKVIRENKFDFIIFLHSLPGFLVADELKRNYKNKFIFDYRDSTYEALPPFKKVVWDLVKFSKATFVSSDAFRRFLPESQSSKIFSTHNLLKESLKHRDEKEKTVPSDRIRLSFWGFIRHEEINLEIIKKISADLRFELHYYGREQNVAENLKNYVAENKVENVFFHGEYSPEDRYEFVKTTDILHNIYLDNNTLLAMGNKYYDGVIFKIPQICMVGSFMGECAEKAGVGITLDPRKDDFCEKIYKYYEGLEKEEFYKNCEKDLQRVLAQTYEGIAKVKEALN